MKLKNILLAILMILIFHNYSFSQWDYYYQVLAKPSGVKIYGRQLPGGSNPSIENRKLYHYERYSNKIYNATFRVSKIGYKGIFPCKQYRY